MKWGSTFFTSIQQEWGICLLGILEYDKDKLIFHWRYIVVLAGVGCVGLAFVCIVLTMVDSNLLMVSETTSRFPINLEAETGILRSKAWKTTIGR